MSDTIRPFCTLPATRIVQQNEHAVWVMGCFPVSPGHSLVIPKRHVGSFFEVSVEERRALLELLNQAKQSVQAQSHLDGFNIGINDGPAAGQTVPHLHTHLIPRYRGRSSALSGGPGPCLRPSPQRTVSRREADPLDVVHLSAIDESGPLRDSEEIWHCRPVESARLPTALRPRSPLAGVF